MLAYAASRKLVAAARSSPHSFLVIGSAHILAVAAVMSVTIDLPARLAEIPFIGSVFQQREAPAHSQSPRRTPRVNLAAIPPESDLAAPNRPPVAEAHATSPQREAFGETTTISPAPLAVGENALPSLVTTGAALAPPYPQQKLLAGEEASLTLVITVDESGKVVAVDPLGRADPGFLETSRRYIVENWRYRPARTNGRATLEKVEARLHFRLDG